MQGVALLISAIASLVTAITGLGLTIYALTRGSARERHDAARIVAERLTEPKELLEGGGDGKHRAPDNGA